jgi:undecaprenyl-diphosphatase
VTTDQSGVTMINFLQRIHHLDTLAFVWVHLKKKWPYRKSVRWLSHTGDGYLYVLSAIIVWFIDTAQSSAFITAGAIAYVLEVSLYLILKNAIKRDRPAIRIKNYRPWITPSDTFSFPSGHTAAAFLFAYLISVHFPLLTVAFYAWASAVGASRVLLGVHYPSDILAGAILGTCCAFVGVAIYSTIGVI